MASKTNCGICGTSGAWVTCHSSGCGETFHLDCARRPGSGVYLHETRHELFCNRHAGKQTKRAKKSVSRSKSANIGAPGHDFGDAALDNFTVNDPIWGAHCFHRAFGKSADGSLLLEDASVEDAPVRPTVSPAKNTAGNPMVNPTGSSDS
jgi:hypothetical protein